MTIFSRKPGSKLPFWQFGAWGKPPKMPKAFFNGGLPKLCEVTDFAQFLKSAIPIRGMHTFKKVAPKMSQKPQNPRPPGSWKIPEFSKNSGIFYSRTPGKIFPDFSKIWKIFPGPG